MSKALFRPAEMYQVPSSAWECVRVGVGLGLVLGLALGLGLGLALGLGPGLGVGVRVASRRLGAELLHQGLVLGHGPRAVVAPLRHALLVGHRALGEVTDHLVRELVAALDLALGLVGPG